MANDFQGYVRQRKNGLWEGQYVFQKHKRSVYGETEVEVRTKLEEIMYSIKKGEYIRPNEYSVSSWLLEWLASYAKASLRPSTYAGYEQYINKHFIPAFGNVFIRNLSVEALQAFFNEKLIGGRCDKESGGLSPKTLKNMKHMLNVAFSQAYYNRMIPFNPVEGVRLPVPDNPEQRVLDETEKNKLFQAVSVKYSTIAKGMIILLNCGLRKGELLGLLWENVSFSENYIRIKHTLSRLPHFEKTSATQDYIRVDTYARENTRTGVYLGPVKTKKGNRTIYLPNSVRKALLELKEIQEEYQQQYSGEQFNPLGFVLCTKGGRPLDPRGFETHFKEIVQEANVKEINVHATRHSFATEALQKSTDLVTISEILGHAMPSTTLDMYGHTFDSKKRALMSMFD